MQISPKRATSASDSSLSAKERSNSRRHSCSCPGLAQPSTTRSRPILRRLVVLALEHYQGILCNSSVKIRSELWSCFAQILQLLINAQTGQVESTENHLSGNPTYQALGRRAEPTY